MRGDYCTFVCTPMLGALAPGRHGVPSSSPARSRVVGRIRRMETSRPRRAPAAATTASSSRVGRTDNQNVDIAEDRARHLGAAGRPRPVDCSSRIPAIGASSSRTTGTGTKSPPSTAPVARTPRCRSRPAPSADSLGVPARSIPQEQARPPPESSSAMTLPPPPRSHQRELVLRVQDDPRHYLPLGP